MGLSFFSSLSIKMGITAAYCDFGSCLGPNTLKYLSAMVESSYISEYILQYSSPVAFVTA